MTTSDYGLLGDIFDFGFWLLSYRFQVFGLYVSWWDLTVAGFFLMLIFYIIRRLASL